MLETSGRDPLPIAGADILALCAGSNAARRDPAVLWLGISSGLPPAPPATWIGHRTPVQTPQSLVSATDLRPGMLVDTLDSGAQQILATRAVTLPDRGRFAPVLLRAPYFAKHVDLLVSQAQLILLAGAGVAYLFGEDAVLALPRHCAMAIRFCQIPVAR